MQSAARTLGLRLLVFNVATDAEVTPAFATLVEQQAGAVVVSGSVIVGANLDQILSHAARFAPSTMFGFSDQARAGGLLSYSADLNEAFRQGGACTGRILKGAACRSGGARAVAGLCRVAPWSISVNCERLTRETQR